MAVVRLVPHSSKGLSYEGVGVDGMLGGYLVGFTIVWHGVAPRLVKITL